MSKYLDKGGLTYLWRKLLGKFKVQQTPVSAPTSSAGTATVFVDSISQDAQGVISYTKKTIIDEKVKQDLGTSDTYYPIISSPTANKTSGSETSTVLYHPALRVNPGKMSVAEGSGGTASGSYSHAGGLGTVANQEAMTAVGKYNVSASTTGQLFAVGNGTSTSNRSNAFTVSNDGLVTVQTGIMKSTDPSETKVWNTSGGTVDLDSFPYVCSDTITDTPKGFVYRQTNNGVGSNKENATIKKFVGNSLVWNQLVTNGNFENTTGWSSIQGASLSVSNNIGTVTSSQGGDSFMQLSTPMVIGHKYYVTATMKTDNTDAGQTMFYIFYGGGSNNKIFRLSTANIWSKQFAIIECVTNQHNFIRLQCENTSYTHQYQNIYLIDLTLMFGSGKEPSTVAEFERLLTEPYYAYNAGTLINNRTQAIETVGFNLWDEEWEQGAINGTTGEPSQNTHYIRSKNYIPVFPNTDYYFSAQANASSNNGFRIAFYDINKSYIGGYFEYLGTARVKAFTTPNNCAYIKFHYGDGRDVAVLTANIYSICINLSDASRNGSYEPYKKSILPINLNSFRVKDSNGNVLTIEGGLKSAGNVYDEITSDGKYIKRIGSVDLGTCNWGYRDLEGRQTFISEMNYVKYRGGDGYLSPNAACTKYANANSNPQVDKSIATGTWFSGTDKSTTVIVDNSYSDAATFKTAISGVTLYYELATPEVYKLVDVIPNNYPVDDLGTEARIAPLDNSGVPGAPFKGDIDYYRSSDSYLHTVTVNGFPAHVENGVANIDLEKAGGHIYDAEKDSLAEGVDATKGSINTASGVRSHAEGFNNTASGFSAHAEGGGNSASGLYAHVEGSVNSASGDFSHAEGNNTSSHGTASHAEGEQASASGLASHAEGNYTRAKGTTSHAEGHETRANGNFSHAEGDSSRANGIASHSEGAATFTSGDFSHAEGEQASASGLASHAEGNYTRAKGTASHAEGYNAEASGSTSHAEGDYTRASGTASHAEGNNTNASGNFSHAEGEQASARGMASHAEGSAEGVEVYMSWPTNGDRYILKYVVDLDVYKYSVFPGDIIESRVDTYYRERTIVSQVTEDSPGVYYIRISNSFSGAGGTVAILRGSANGIASHTEGQGNRTDADFSHAEGHNTRTQGLASHSEGFETVASGDSSHAEGEHASASGFASHAEGCNETMTFALIPDVTVTSNYENNHLIVSWPGLQYEQLPTKYFSVGDTIRYNGTQAKVTNLLSSPSRIALDQAIPYVEDITSIYKECIDITGHDASGKASHIEGISNHASGDASHAEGQDSTAIGAASHSEGRGNTAKNDFEHAEGKYNVSISGTTIHTVGVGNSTTHKNAHLITLDGLHYIPGIGGYVGTETGLTGVSDVATVINSKADSSLLNNYLPLSGGTMTGAIIPNANETIDFGSSSKYWGTMYAKAITVSGGFTKKTGASTSAVWDTSGGTRSITTTVASGSTDLITAGAVWTAIDNLPDPMVFRGTLGTGSTATISALPVDGSAKVGDTYKVITDGTYAGQASKSGDVFSCNGKTASANTWVYIPAGDDIEDTWRNLKINGTEFLASGISTGALDIVNGDYTTPVWNSTNKTFQVNHNTTTRNDTSSTASPASGGNFTVVDSVTTNTYGHVTAVNVKTVTLPVDPNTHRTVKINGTELASGTTLTLTGGTGISISNSNGTATINHSNSITAGTASGSTGSVGFSGSINIPSISYDAQGHITGKTTTTVTLPANPNTDYMVQQSTSDTANYRALLSTYSADATPNSIAEGTSPTYFTRLAYMQPSTGNIYTAGSVSVGASTPTAGGTMQYDATERCIKFSFG